jgi:hypothetical protein
MLIHIENQEKLDELWTLLGELPIDLHHRFQGDTFPMVAELRLWLDDCHDKGELFLSDDSLTWEPISVWEQKLEKKLHARFGNPLEENKCQQRQTNE